MRKCTLLALSAFAMLAGLVSAQPTASKEEQLAAPCFKVATEAEFVAAEKEAPTKAIDLPNSASQGPVYIRAATKADPTDNSSGLSVYGVILRGAAVFADTRPGFLLKCSIMQENSKVPIVKYYVTTGPLDRIDKGQLGPKDGAFIYFPPDIRNVETVTITVLTLSQGGHRTKYSGTATY